MFGPSSIVDRPSYRLYVHTIPLSGRMDRHSVYSPASVINSVTQKVPTSDAKLRSFIPPQVLKMNPKLCQICGYAICIITKVIHID